MDDTKTMKAEDRKLGGPSLPPPAGLESKIRELALRVEEAGSAAEAKGKAIREGVTEALRFYRLLPGQETRPDLSLFASDAGMEKLLQQRLVQAQMRWAIPPILLQAAEGILTAEPNEKHAYVYTGSVAEDVYVQAAVLTWMGAEASCGRALALSNILTGGRDTRAETDTDAWWDRKQRIGAVYRASLEESRPQIAAFKTRMLALVQQHGPAKDSPFSLTGYIDESGMRRLLKDRLHVLADAWCTANAFLLFASPRGDNTEARIIGGIQDRIASPLEDLRLTVALRHGLGLEIDDMSVRAVLTGALFLTDGEVACAWSRVRYARELARKKGTDTDAK